MKIHWCATEWRAAAVYTIWKRISNIFLPYSIHDLGINISGACKIMRKTCRKHEATRILKTWTNSWATSHRMHETTWLPCLFGCQEAEDSFNHYVHCPFWFALLIKLHPDSCSTLPLVRLGLISPKLDSLLSVACSFAGYHAMRRYHKKNQLGAEPLNPHNIHFTHMTFLDYYCVAAKDCGLACTVFSSLASDEYFSEGIMRASPRA